MLTEPQFQLPRRLSCGERAAMKAGARGKSKLAGLTALTQPSPPGEGYYVRRPSEKSAVELSGHAVANPKADCGSSLSLGEGAGVRADVAATPFLISKQETAKIPSNLTKSGLEKGKSGLEIARSGLEKRFSTSEMAISKPDLTNSKSEIAIPDLEITRLEPEIAISDLEIPISSPKITISNLGIARSELGIAIPGFEIAISKALLIRKMVKNRHLTVKCPTRGHFNRQDAKDAKMKLKQKAELVWKKLASLAARRFVNYANIH